MRQTKEREAPKRLELVILVVCFITCSLIGGALSLLVIQSSGLAPNTAALDELIAGRWVLRMQLGISNLFGFLLTGVSFSVLIHRGDWLKSVRADASPPPLVYPIAVAAVIVAAGMVAYSFQLNQLLPLPDSAIAAEASTQNLVQAALTMENPWELLAGLFVVAVIPALGEEWIFRGIIQNHLQRWFSNPHLAVWLAAATFSAIHFQFQGFLPRMLLGAMLGYMFTWSKSLWLPVAVHLFNNGAQIVGYYIVSQTEETPDFHEMEMQEVAAWQGLASTAASLGLMYLLWRVCEPMRKQK